MEQRHPHILRLSALWLHNEAGYVTCRVGGWEYHLSFMGLHLVVLITQNTYPFIYGKEYLIIYVFNEMRLIR